MKYKDLTNKVFGGITAIERDEKLSKEKHRGWWKCRCNYCEKEVYYRSDELQKSPYSCGCVKKPVHNFINETGKRYGRLIVLSKNTDFHEDTSAYWNCLCDCGNEAVVQGWCLRVGRAISCGCKSKEFYKYTSKQLIDETGNRYGALTVLRRNIENAPDSSGWWDCLCDCGNIIMCRGANLRAGWNLSCGCKRHSRGEKVIANLLAEKHIVYKEQQTFSDFRFSKTGGVPRYDFGVYFNEELTFLIEYNGIQHYKPVEYFHEPIQDIQSRDKEKIAYCQSHNIPLEIIPYTEFNDLEEKISELLKKYDVLNQKGGEK